MMRAAAAAAGAPGVFELKLRQRAHQEVLLLLELRVVLWHNNKQQSQRRQMPKGGPSTEAEGVGVVVA